MKVTVEASKAHQELVRRVVASGNPNSVQVWFDAHVLDRYRDDPDARILRSDTAGRLRGPGNWLVNFGIAANDQLVHLPVSALGALPERDQAHWLSHLVNLPASETFLRMTVNPNACFDDGESRDW